MTHAELLELIEACDPADLTPDEIARLRAAVETSPEIARAVSERVALDQRLFHSLGQPNLPVERILARARGTTHGRGWAPLLASVILLLGGGGAVMAWLSRGSGREVAATPRAVELEEAESPPREPASEPTVAEEPAPSDTADEPVRPSADAAAGTATPPPPAAAASAPGADRGPWAIDPEVVALARRAPEQLLLPLPDSGRLQPSQAELARWLEPVPDAPGGKPRGDLSERRFAGLYRLRPPLAEGTALRITIHDLRRLRIHAWSGASGATLASYEWLNPPIAPWAGFMTTRKGSTPLPGSLVLAARDDGRVWRAGGRSGSPLLSTIDLRYEDGLLTLSHGDVRWLDVPLANRPTEIYLDLAVGRPHRLELIPALPLPPLPAIATEPADVPLQAGAVWINTPPPESGAAVVEADAGGVTFSAAENKQPAATLLRLPPSPGPREVVVRVDSADAGTGIALGDAEGKVIQIFSVQAASQNKAQRLLMPAADQRKGLEVDAEFEKGMFAFIGAATWLKFVECGGQIDAFTSADGIHWAHAHSGPRGGPATIGSIGPHAIAHPSRRSITIGSVQVGSFQRLAAAAEPEPLRELANGCTQDRAIEILDVTWRKSLTAAIEPKAAVALLDEFATLAPVWGHIDHATRVAAWYADLGRSLLERGDEHAYTAIAWRQQVAPIRCWHVYSFFPAALARAEACGHVVARRWDDLNSLGRRVVSFNLTWTPQPAPLYDWATRVRGTPRADAWPHPLDLALGKEAGRVADDLRAALDDDDVSGACEVIVAAGAAGERGLAGDATDPDLAVSLPTLVQSLLRDEPGLRDALRKGFADRAAVRLRQAIDTADAALLETVAAQYPGTPQAAEAHLLLGDRRLAAGQGGLAGWHYRAAGEADPEVDAARREAAAALAAAVDGTAAPPAPTADAVAAVPIGAATLPADGWRSLAAELRAAREATQPFNRSGGLATVATVLPPAGPIEWVPRGRMEGDVGTAPQKLPTEYNVAAGPPADVIDWVARQTAATAAGSRFIVSNRFQVAAHDASTGAVQWRVGLGGEAGAAHGLPGQPMRPVVSRDHVFVRRLSKTGPSLASLGIADGAIVWQTAAARPGWVVVSDPVLDDRTLHAVTAAPVIGGRLLALASFSAVTGELLAEHELFTIRDAAAELATACQLTPVDGMLVVTCAGGVACIDPQGGIRWVRRQPWIPPAVDAAWRLQASEPPLAVGDAVVVVQPAAPAVTAIDSAHGRVRWQWACDGIRRGLGITEAAGQAVVVVERSGGLTALAADSGEVVWRAELAGLLDGCLVSRASGILAAVHEPVVGQKTSTPILLWLDAATGTVRHRGPIDALASPLPRLGPIVEAGGKFWVFAGSGPTDATRSIGELTAKPAAAAAGP